MSEGELVRTLSLGFALSLHCPASPRIGIPPARAEFGFMSTTPKRKIALGYAREGEDGTRLLFEIKMGLVDRGADISWMSQYPHEQVHMHSACLYRSPHVVRR